MYCTHHFLRSQILQRNAIGARQTSIPFVLPTPLSTINEKARPKTKAPPPSLQSHPCDLTYFALCFFVPQPSRWNLLTDFISLGQQTDEWAPNLTRCQRLFYRWSALIYKTHCFSFPRRFCSSFTDPTRLAKDSAKPITREQDLLSCCDSIALP